MAGGSIAGMGAWAKSLVFLVTIRSRLAACAQAICTLSSKSFPGKRRARRKITSSTGNIFQGGEDTVNGGKCRYRHP